MTEWIRRLNDAVNGFVWGPVALSLLVGIGLWFSLTTGFFQFRRFPQIFKKTLGGIFHKNGKTKGTITPFQALTTALAGSVGTGNIAGVAGAVLLGGPGAVFWMWISALFGMMTKFAEIYLAVRFRKKNSAGEWVGGPMYYIEGGLGKRAKPFAILFAVSATVASFGMGNMVQVNTLASALIDAVERISSVVILQNERNIRLIIGVITAFLSALVILGGAKRIGRFTERVIPFMSLFYIVVTVTVILVNFRYVPAVLKSIVQGAFDGIRPVLGGTVGFTVSAAMRQGISRGVFSNEAGLGSSSIAHASAESESSVHQGFYGMMEVFIDTVVLCTLTALALLCSGIPLPYCDASVAGAPLMGAAIGTVFGQGFSSGFLAVAIFFFALSTLIGWSLYGVRCTEYLFGPRGVLWYRILFVCMIPVGAMMELSLVWSISDTFNGCMALPNMIALVLLSGTVLRGVREYDRLD